MGTRVLGLALALAGFLIGPAATAFELSELTHEVYYGDFNHDGDYGDVYFHRKDMFVLIHGEVPVPLYITSEQSFVVYSGSNELVPLKLASSQLMVYRKAALGLDYYFSDTNADGFDDITAALPGESGGSIVLQGLSLSLTVTVPEAVSQAYQYDALGRLTRVYENEQIKAGYCYDDAGNRTAVSEGGGGADDCESALPIQPPESLSVVTHWGAGYTISWGPVEGATYYQLKFGANAPVVIDNPSQTSYSTGSNTLADEPVWIQACDQVNCSVKAYF